jgi:putative transcriptional regulator
VLTKKKPSTRVSVGEEMLSRLTELAEALENGEPITCRRVVLQLPLEPFSPKDVQKTRRILGASQAMFARFLGVKPKTVQAWEQGTCTPGEMACRFMDEIRNDPEYWLKRFQRSLVPKQV